MNSTGRLRHRFDSDAAPDIVGGGKVALFAVVLQR